MLTSLALSLLSCASCFKSDAASLSSDTTNLIGSKMKIKIGNKTFTATLYDNATVKAFKSLLPMTLTMVELNRNEKYADLPRSLPADASNLITVENGDLMLYGSSTVVLFYKSFSTSYSYTKLGRIDDVTGLVSALGSSNVDVSLELK